MAEFNLTFDQISRLTRYQVRHLYLDIRRDDKGKLILSGDQKAPKAVPWDRTIRVIHRINCWPEWRIDIVIRQERARREAAAAEEREASKRGIKPGRPVRQGRTSRAGKGKG